LSASLRCVATVKLKIDLYSRLRIQSGIKSAEEIAAEVKEIQTAAFAKLAAEQRAKEVAMFEGFATQR
jgi:hypothetical protein